MTRRNVLRAFWQGAAAALVVAALVAIVAVVRGSLGETEGNILATLGTALLAGAALTAGLTLLETREARLGAAVAASAPLWAAIAVAAIWIGFDGRWARAALTAYLLLAAELLLATSRLLAADRRRLRPLALATAALLVLSTGLTLVAVWGPEVSPKLLVTLWILAVLGYLLIPVLRRIATTPAEGAPRRVDLATEAAVGGVTVRLLGPSPGRTRGRRDLLYLVLDGALRLDGLELGRGEAALVPRGVAHAPEPAPGARVVVVG